MASERDGFEGGMACDPFVPTGDLLVFWLSYQLPCPIPMSQPGKQEKKTGVDCCNAMVNIVLLNLSYSTVLGNPLAHWIHLE